MKYETDNRIGLLNPKGSFIYQLLLNLNSMRKIIFPFAFYDISEVNRLEPEIVEALKNKPPKEDDEWRNSTRSGSVIGPL